MRGLGPARSGAWVGRDSLQVTTGRGFRAEIPARAVSEVGPDGTAVGGWASTAGVGGALKKRWTPSAVTQPSP